MRDSFPFPSDFIDFGLNLGFATDIKSSGLIVSLRIIIVDDPPFATPN